MDSRLVTVEEKSDNLKDLEQRLDVLEHAEEVVERIGGLKETVISLEHDYRTLRCDQVRCSSLV